MLNVPNLVRVSASRATSACLAVPTLSMFGTICKEVSFLCLIFYHHYTVITNVIEITCNGAYLVSSRFWRVSGFSPSWALLFFDQYFFSLDLEHNISIFDEYIFSHDLEHLLHLTNMFRFTWPWTLKLHLTNISFHLTLNTFFTSQIFLFSWPWRQDAVRPSEMGLRATSLESVEEYLNI